MLCRRAIKGSFKFKLAIEVFKIINIILLYEEWFYPHVFILVSGDITADDFTFFSEVVFSPSCWRHRTELPTAAWLSLPISTFLQPFRRTGCVKKPEWGGGRNLAEHSINHWGQAEGVVYSKRSLEYDEGDKECYFRPRNFSCGGFSRNQGLPTWKPDDSNLVQAFRLTRSPFSATGRDPG